MRYARIPATILLSMVVASATADRAFADDAPKGWEKILVPTDPVLVNSIPSPGQLRYQTHQYGAFLHYGPAVFMSGDYCATPDPKVFNPTELDAEQWVRVAKSFGAKHLVLSTKHHNGFCLWPTMTTGYCVRSSPWRDGKGDLVREVADACKKHGLALGLYYSGHDQHFPCHALDRTNHIMTQDGPMLANREAYWPVYCRQIEELLTNYGDIICLWLDGWGDPFDWHAQDPKTGKLYGDEILDLIRSKQPNIVIWHGNRPDFHYCKNEEGVAPYPLWNVLRKGEGATLWDLPPWTEGWVIPETYNCHGTFRWVPATPEKLMDEYYQSVGRGANFLQALVPDQRGLIDDACVKTMADFGAEVCRRFGIPVARTDSNAGWLEPGVLEIDLGELKTVTHIVLEEDIAKGQHVLKYALEALSDGQWKTVAQGESIGRKRIERFEPAISAEKIRLRVVQANAVPSISDMLVFNQ